MVDVGFRGSGRLCGLVVLADQAAEYLPAPDRQVHGGGDGLGGQFSIGWAMIAGLVRLNKCGLAVRVAHTTAFTQMFQLCGPVTA
jgi:hypothetical protein